MVCGDTYGSSARIKASSEQPVFCSGAGKMETGYELRVVSFAARPLCPRGPRLPPIARLDWITRGESEAVHSNQQRTEGSISL